MTRLVVIAALAAFTLAGCQTGMSYADAQASCEAQGYRLGTKRFDRCVNDLYRDVASGPATTVTFGVVEEPVYVSPAPVVYGGYYGAPVYYGRRPYGGPYYGNYYWR